MIERFIFLLLFISIIQIYPALAQENKFPLTIKNEKSFGLMNFVRLISFDEVSGNCWTNKDSILSRAKLKFEQNEISVISYETAFVNVFQPVVSLSGLGYRTSTGLCVGSASIKVMYKSSSYYGGHSGTQNYEVETLAVPFSQHSIFSSPDNFNEQFSDFFDGQVSELLSKALAARRDADVKKLLIENPIFRQEPISMEKFNEMIEAFQKGAVDQ